MCIGMATQYSNYVWTILAVYLCLQNLVVNGQRKFVGNNYEQ